MTLDEAIADNLRIAEGQDKCAEISVSEHAKERMKVCADEHRQLAEWLRELKELRKLAVINPIIAGYNEVYEKLRKGDIETSNDKDLLKTAVGTLENVMPKYRRLSEENQKQKEQIAEYKRLLKAAVKDINFYVDCYEAHCDECCCSHDNHCHWKYEAAALKLIGEDETDG